MQQYKIPLILIALGGGLLAYRGMHSSPSFQPTRYPRDLAEIKKAGGFSKLSPEQQVYVRYRYVHELQLLMGQVNQRMQMAQFAGDLAACYTYRTLIERLKESIRRPGAVCRSHRGTDGDYERVDLPQIAASRTGLSILVRPVACQPRFPTDDGSWNNVNYLKPFGKSDCWESSLDRWWLEHTILSVKQHENNCCERHRIATTAAYGMVSEGSSLAETADIGHVRG